MNSFVASTTHAIVVIAVLVTFCIYTLLQKKTDDQPVLRTLSNAASTGNLSQAIIIAPEQALHNESEHKQTSSISRRHLTMVRTCMRTVWGQMINT